MPAPFGALFSRSMNRKHFPNFPGLRGPWLHVPSFNLGSNSNSRFRQLTPHLASRSPKNLVNFSKQQYFTSSPLVASSPTTSTTLSLRTLVSYYTRAVLSPNVSLV